MPWRSGSASSEDELARVTDPLSHGIKTALGACLSVKRFTEGLPELRLERQSRKLRQASVQTFALPDQAGAPQCCLRERQPGVLLAGSCRGTLPCTISPGSAPHGQPQSAGTDLQGVCDDQLRQGRQPVPLQVEAARKLHAPRPGSSEGALVCQVAPTLSTHHTCRPAMCALRHWPRWDSTHTLACTQAASVKPGSASSDVARQPRAT